MKLSEEEILLKLKMRISEYEKTLDVLKWELHSMYPTGVKSLRDAKRLEIKHTTALVTELKNLFWEVP